MKGYFSIFISGVFATLGSVVMAGVLVADAFYKDVPQEVSILWVERALAAVIVIACFCHLFIILGRPQWTWGVVLVLLACLLAALPTIEHRPQKVIYFLGVFCPLLGLLVMNSARHRELRRISVEVRYQRQRFMALRQARIRRQKAERRK